MEPTGLGFAGLNYGNQEQGVGAYTRKVRSLPIATVTAVGWGLSLWMERVILRSVTMHPVPPNTHPSGIPVVWPQIPFEAAENTIRPVRGIHVLLHSSLISARAHLSLISSP